MRNISFCLFNLIVHPKRGIARYPTRLKSALLPLVFIAGLPSICRPQSEYAQPEPSFRKFEQKRVGIKIIARGSRVVSSTGNMDSYLAIIFANGRGAPTVAQLVRYYAFATDSLHDEDLAAHRQLHLKLHYAGYCGVSAQDFIAKRIFDRTAWDMAQQQHDAALPCFLIHD
jgi:hypothetical protein